MFSALLVTAGLAGCGTDQTAAPSTSTEQALADTSYSTGLKAQDGFTRVAQTDALELFINGKTAELCVREKASDRRWYSTPQEGESRQALLAQIELRYANSKSQISTMNSYADAVELGQFVWEACEGGVRVVYDIGKRKKVYTMPTVITKTRFEQVLLAGLSETDRTTVRGFYTAYSLSSASSQVVREELISKYPRIQDDDVYVLMDGLADFAAARLEAVIVSGGYTQEELEKDNAENQVAAPEASITFRVPVEYTLDKDGFVARVVTEDIQCPSSAHLLTLSLLPYFGAAGEKEEGYMLVPDGSGALIRLNNGKASQGLYQAGLYGDNLTAGRSDVLTEKQAVPLPVNVMRPPQSDEPCVTELSPQLGRDSGCALLYGHQHVFLSKNHDARGFAGAVLLPERGRQHLFRHGPPVSAVPAGRRHPAPASRGEARPLSEPAWRHRLRGRHCRHSGAKDRGADHL